MDREVAFTAAGELAEQTNFFWAELRNIGSKFLSAQLLEYEGPDALNLVGLKQRALKRQLSADEGQEIRVSEGLLVQPVREQLAFEII